MNDTASLQSRQTVRTRTERASIEAHTTAIFQRTGAYAGTELLRQNARLMVPTDFSEASIQALLYAVPLARQLNGKITLLHVLQWPLVPASLGALFVGEPKSLETAKESLRGLAEAKIPKELLETTVVRVGHAPSDIITAARTLKMDAVVISTHGRTGLKRALIGSIAEQVVRHATCPVLAVPCRSPRLRKPGAKSRGLALHVNRILVPVDLSEGSAKAVEKAANLANTMHAHLALLHVLPPLPLNSGRFRAEIRCFNKEATLAARRDLLALAASVPPGIKTKALVRQDIVWRGIIGGARAWGADMILLSTRGLRGPKRFVLGGTAETVVRHTSCPVMIVR